MDRRRFLTGATVVAAGVAVGRVVNGRAMAVEPEPDNVVVGGRHAGLTVPAGQTWELRGTVESTANVIVYGTLRMRSGSTLRFVDINESAFVGGGHDPIASDVGLWVMDAGVLDVQGTLKTGWNRTGTDSTWLSTDELITAPLTLGDYSNFAPFILGAPVPYIEGPDGVRYHTEVLNLTREVAIEGTSTGRTHVFIRSIQPQTIRHAVLRHMGPKAGDVGRYGLHFHHCEDGSRGSLVEGVVVRDCGNHAFVPHASHGITFRDCITYNIGADAYWWDPAPSRFDYPENASFDVTYDHCMAAKVYPRDGLGKHILTGFFLGHGTGNSCVDCVAVAVQGGATASGFHWPESANLQPNIWRFERGVAHNNLRNGVYVWQNGASDERHPVNGLICYRNGEHGVDHGAYANAYDYSGLVCFGNGLEPVLSHALAQTIGQNWFAPVLDASGVAHALRITKHRTQPRAAVVFADARFERMSSRAVVVEETSTMHGLYDFVRCLPDGRDLEASDFKVVYMHPDSVYRVQRRDGTAFRLRRDGTASPIAAFA